MDRTGGNSIIENMADILSGKDGAGRDKHQTSCFTPTFRTIIF